MTSLVWVGAAVCISVVSVILMLVGAPVFLLRHLPLFCLAAATAVGGTVAVVVVVVALSLGEIILD